MISQSKKIGVRVYLYLIFFLPGLTLGADPWLEVLVVPEEVELQSGLRGQLLLARRVRTLKSKNQALKGTLVRQTIHRDFDL